jgi:hypothetical protein
MGLVDSFYAKVYITVLIKDKECNINVEVIKNGSIKKRDTARYFLEKDMLSETMIRYLLSYKNRYSFVYISVLLVSQKQGAISGTLKSNLQKFDVNLQSVDVKVIENNFLIYSDVEELNLMQQRFEATNIDLILSPFALLHYQCRSQMRDSKTQMFILYKVDATVITIFKAGSLLFATFLPNHNEEDFSRTLIKKKEDMKIETKAEKDDDHEDEEEDDLMFFDTDDDDDSDEDDLEVSEPEPEPEEEEPEVEEEPEEETEEEKLQRMLEQSSLEKGQKLLVAIKDSLDEFYKSELYSSDFVSNIVIIDTDALGDQVNSFIEDELLIPVSRTDIEIKDLFMNITKAEVNS